MREPIYHLTFEYGLNFEYTEICICKTRARAPLEEAQRVQYPRNISIVRDIIQTISKF